MADTLSFLELLAREGSPDEFEMVVAVARRNGVTGEGLEELERAKRLSLAVHAQLERHQQREGTFATLVDTARELAKPPDLDVLLNVTTRRARLLLRVDMAYIGMPDDDLKEVCIRAADGHTSMLSVGLRLPNTGGVGRKVLTDSLPFWTPDYLVDQRFVHSERTDEVVRAEGLHAIMAAPLVYEKAPFGILYVGDRNVRHFKVDEISLLSSLASLASAMIEKARWLEVATGRAESLRIRVEEAESQLGSLADLAEVHQGLMDMALSGGNFQTLAEEAGHRLRASVQLRAADGAVLATAGRLPEREDLVLLARMNAHAAREPFYLEGMWAAPVLAGDGHLGTLLVFPTEPLDEWARRLLGIVAQVAAVLVLLDRKPGMLEAGDRGELLDDLLANPPRPAQRLRKRARWLGMDLDTDHVVVLSRTDGAARGKAAVWAASYAHSMGGLHTVKNGCNVLLLMGSDPGEAARAVSAKLSPLLDTPVTVAAAGPVSDPASVRSGFAEALRCLEAMTTLGAGGSAASVGDLGFLGVLLADSPDIDGFIAVAIGPVLEYDRQRSTELVQTLGAYFESGSSPTYAAEKLHVHPNTVSRRLERIGELLGPGWQDTERSLDIQLALRLVRLRHLLGGSITPGTGREGG
ncbi:helix-turn-helix domain-containing protein [Microbispora triticiradicis]|uniref:GAF domain-containing protein n=2 Tax=Microbispora TaxID=2005 RepID=A0ABY3M2Z6_9ACTN|nr:MULTISPECIES: helix-turn-helix domain-containing protein [Microbispora]TLP54045.1 GAF domain-containing protein [Microbispora fusca]TYB65100.1 GAF domain-containing protein [Microbispora tritici]